MSNHFDTENIGCIIQEEMKELKIPGLAIAIVSGKDIIYLKGFGKTNESGGRVTEKTAFYIGSSSKSFTAMAVMQLEEAGALNIDDLVIRYMPEFRCLHNGEEVTIRQLLNHTSGFSTYEGMKIYNRKAKESLSQPSNNRHNVRLSRKPGASYEYSNLNYVILGAIIEIVSGMTYEDFIVNKIFKPLDMHRSFADCRKALEYGLEKGYQPVLGSIRQTEYEVHQELIPAGYLATCAEDMAKYMIANLNGGSYKNSIILSEDGISMLHTKSSETSDHYGLGWFDFGELVHHGGSCENYHANMMLLPSRRIGIAIMYNINDNISGAFIKGSFGSGETVSYDRIQSRIINALTQKDIVSPVIAGNKGFHEKANIIFGSLFVLSAIYGLAVLISTAVNLPMLLINDFLLPILLLIAVPRLFKATWKALFRFAAGFTHVLYGLQLFLILIGVLKLIAISV
ncbi:MAG: serine hydrolase domain-containing protein [Anaerocolumna sp.]